MFQCGASFLHKLEPFENSDLSSTASWWNLINIEGNPRLIWPGYIETFDYFASKAYRISKYVISYLKSDVV